MTMKAAHFNSPSELADFVNSVEKVTAAVVPVAPPGGGGSGYAVGDLLHVLGGEGDMAVLEVAAEAGGVITSVTVRTPGAYMSVPPNPVNVNEGDAFFDLTTATILSGSADIDSILVKDGQWVLEYQE